MASSDASLRALGCCASCSPSKCATSASVPARIRGASVVSLSVHRRADGSHRACETPSASMLRHRPDGTGSQSLHPRGAEESRGKICVYADPRSAPFALVELLNVRLMPCSRTPGLMTT
jgi:hypothetical protein